MLLKINVRWDVNDDANVDDDDATRLIIDVPELRLMKKRRDTTYTRSASARTALSLSLRSSLTLSLSRPVRRKRRGRCFGWQWRLRVAKARESAAG